MRFRKNVPAEHREFLQEQLKQYKKEMTMTKNELRELEKWVASGRSPYDEYYGAAEPPVRCGESHLSGLTEPPHFVY